MEIRKAALIGMGAIGTVYGHLLFRKYGKDFAVIAKGARGEKFRKNGAVLNGRAFFPSVLSSRDERFCPDLVIVSVKNYQLDETIEDLREFVGRETVILPLLNGISARGRLEEAFPLNRVLYGLAISIDALRTSEGVVNTVDGTIQFGEADNTSPSPLVRSVDGYLAGAGIHSEVCADMTRTTWRKWMLNVGCNQVSAATGSVYGKLTRIDSNLTLLREAMLEVVALAKAAQVNLTEKDESDVEKYMAAFSPESKTSMLQDVEAHRRTEVDYFAGTVEKLGREYGIATPVNHVLYCIIKSKEQLYSAPTA